MTVRKAQEKDIIEVISVSKNILEDLTVREMSEYCDDVTADEVKAAMQPKSRTLIMLQRGKIIGFALLQSPIDEEISRCQKEFGEDLNPVILSGYGIHPKYQGKGYGKILAQYIKDKAKGMGYNSVYGNLHPDNVPAIACLSHMGTFFECGEMFAYKTKEGQMLRRQEFVAIF